MLLHEDFFLGFLVIIEVYFVDFVAEWSFFT